MSLEKPAEHTNDCDTLVDATKVLLEPRSLFVMAGCSRYEWRHGITRQSQLHIPCESCDGGGTEAVSSDGGENGHSFAEGVGAMRTVHRDGSYRRVSLTIRHLLPGRKQVASSLSFVPQ